MKYGSAAMTDNAYFFWIPLFAPLVGGVTGAILYHIFIAAHWEDEEDKEALKNIAKYCVYFIYTVYTIIFHNFKIQNYKFQPLKGRIRAGGWQTRSRQPTTGCRGRLLERLKNVIELIVFSDYVPVKPGKNFKIYKLNCWRHLIKNLRYNCWCRNFSLTDQ